MALAAGDRLGPYEITGPIGAGGMGEVYKARDTRLNRTVAIKVLPQHIASGDDARRRFEHETRTVASLNHPHICTLHDAGDQDGIGYMVMEYLDGETLAARIEKVALPLERAIPIAIQIADALDCAHRAGVAHRDIKPGNIMITRDGVKVLDFGLAKSTVKPGPSDETLTVNTTAGMVHGTPQYMAPEQFEGREADVRADIWAFGAVIYEMVTGEKAFQGRSHASLLGAILTADPAPMRVKPSAPPALEKLVRRCLSKDPEDRYQSIRDVVLDLHSMETRPNVPAKTVPARPWAAWIVAGIASLAALVFGLNQFRQPRPQIIRTFINPPNKGLFGDVAISPDGRLFAFTATLDRKRQLYVQPLDSVIAQPLAGTLNAEQPFWSPDSHWIGYFAEGKLVKINSAGGQPLPVCNLSVLSFGGAWSQDGLIAFADALGIWRVPAQGGTPVEILLNKEPGRYIRPYFLPDGRSLLYELTFRDRNVSGTYLDKLNGSKPIRLLGDSSQPVYASDRQGIGYLLFVRAGTLMANSFDARSGALSGDAFPVPGTVVEDEYRRTLFSSSHGLLVYRSLAATDTAPLTWLDRSGALVSTIETAGPVRSPAISSDEKTIAFQDMKSGHIWLHQPGSALIRFTFGQGVYQFPVWSPDGASIAYSHSGGGTRDLYRKMSTGGSEELLLKAANLLSASDWSVDGGTLLYTEQDLKTGYDLWALPLRGDRKPVSLVKTGFHEEKAVFSPDSKFIAYHSNESGRFEVYVQTYPPTEAKWQISKQGGTVPRWPRDSKEVFFLDPDGSMMAAEVSTAPTVRIGTPISLFWTSLTGTTVRYSVSRDGKRFLLPQEGRAATAAVLVQNFLEEARR